MKRVFQGISGMILLLVVSVISAQVKAQCTVDLLVNQNPSTCFSYVALGSTNSSQVVSWTYYIDGEIISTSGQAVVILPPGTYAAAVVTIDNQNCTAVDNVSFTVAGTPISVNAGADVFMCQAQAVLGASVSASNPYSVSWNPAEGLSNPNSPTPLVVQNVHNQQFVINVTDNVTGCVASDSVIVSQYNALFDSLDLCQGPVTIDLGPGAQYYQWLSWTDTAGNNQPLSYPSNQQSITVNEPGQYFMYANFPGCGPLTSLVTVEPCSDCWNYFVYDLTFQGCYATSQFVSTGSGQLVSFFWDFGDGTTSTLANPTHQYSAGTYIVSLTTIDADQCTVTTTQTLSVTTGFSITMSEDTAACHEAAIMEVSTSGGSGDFSYSWSPTQGVFSDPTQPTYYVQAVHEQVYHVTVTDNVSGCQETDSVTVSSYIGFSETLYLCDDSVYIDLGPGAQFYNLQPLSWNQQAQSVWTDQPGQYVFYAAFPNCGAITSTFEVLPCNENCSNYFSVQTNPNQCGAVAIFFPGFDSQVDSVGWNMGDGTAFTTNSYGPYTHVFASGGEYQVTLTGYHSDGCVSISFQTVTVAGLQAQINGDTIACAGQLMLFSSASGGSGNYTFSWSPAVLMTSPTSQSTLMNVQGEQLAYVTVYDTQNQCSATDSVYIYPNQQMNQTLELCSGGAYLEVNPGSMIYNWTYTPAGGGNAVTLQNQTNSYTAFNLGTYVVMTYYSGCQQIFHTFTVVACTGTCTSSISNTGLTYQNCGASIDLVASYSSPIDSAIWDLGNGSVLVDDGSGIPTQFYPGGSYLVYLTAYHSNGCISTTSYSIILLTDITTQMNVADTIACAGQQFLSVSATGGGGQYAYYWPITGSTSQSTVMGLTQSQWVVVEVTDTYTNCTVSDSVYIYANQQINTTVQLCQSSVPLIVEPGSMVYNWSYTPVGGTEVTLPNQTNQLDATNLGTYQCFTYYSGCVPVEHTFEVVQCGTSCFVDLVYSVNQQQCGQWYAFIANPASSIDSLIYDFGDGTSFTTSIINNTYHFYGPGTYTATVTAYHTTGCISTDAATFSINNGISIALNLDSVACNGMFFPNYVITGGSGNYTYNWTPALLMNDPTSANPIMNVQYDTWIEVIITDTQQGCSVSDSMYVYANLPINQTVDLCTDSVLWVNPGSMIYNWSYTDLLGNSSQLQVFGNQMVATAPGTYVCFSYYSGCNTITHVFVVEACSGNDDVWPGDANSDNIVTNSDALYLGLAFNQTGPVRPAATINWVGQPCPDWTFNFAVNDVNLKHADCDGNGIINFNDTLAINFNYLNTHNKFEGVSVGGNPPIWIEATPDTVGLSQYIDIVVHVGTAEQPVDSLHGVAFSMTFNESYLSQNGFTVDFENSVLGTAGSDVLTFQKNLFNDGMIDVAVSRTTLQNFQGYGPIAHARIVTTDNLSGIHELPIGISGVVALSNAETPVELTAIGDVVVIDPSKVGVEEAEMSNLLIYPNPASDILNLSGLEGEGIIIVHNAIGQVLISTSFAGTGQMQIGLSELSTGIYVIRLETPETVTTRKFRVVR